MEIVNTCVFCEQTKKTIFPWTIIEVSESEHTFLDFFEECILPRIAGSSTAIYELKCTHVGTSKTLLDPVDPSLYVLPVIKSFGRFLKYCVNTAAESVSHRTLNAFDILMDAAARISSSSNTASNLREFVNPVNERNKKDKLFNDIAKFLESKGLKFTSDEIDTNGKALVVLLCDILWHIDGHHHVFKQRSAEIPSVFSQFTYYNTPELSKHRKRRTCNLSADLIQQHVLELTTVLHAKYWSREGWLEFRGDVFNLSLSLAGYVEYLSEKNKKMKIRHKSPTPVRQLSEYLQVKFLSSCSTSQTFDAIEAAFENKSIFEYVNLSSYLPQEPVKRHRMLDSIIQSGLSSPCVLLTYAPGSNIGNLNFLWKVPNDIEPVQCLERSQCIIENIKKEIPTFHTRAMKCALFEKFGRVSSSVKPAYLRYFYKDLTGDQSASETTDQSKVDNRIHQILDMEDPSTIDDLRTLNTGAASRYDRFWEECDKYLHDKTAVDDRRHDSVTHLAHAVSVRDFVEQVKRRCPSDTLVPSVEWVRLQFWPKTPSAKVALHYTGRLRVRFKVQQRQWRRSHIDSHYAAASFRYMREYSLQLKDYCLFVCLDDKHKIKIGECDFPVASAERGRRVIVNNEQIFTAGDHDFTKFGIIPSVIFIVDIPDTITDSWYTGDIFVGLKNSVFEPSSPIRHTCELYQVLRSVSFSSPVLFVYTDGGPDHRITYVSVQLSLICLFLKLDLDFLCAGRTAPYHSWKNPVERVMSLLNLGLQCVALARDEMSEEYEKEAAKCNNLTELRRIAVKKPGIESAVKDSLSRVKVLLSNIFMRLQWKDKYVHMFNSATLEEISDFWSAIMAIDSSLTVDGKYVQSNISNHPSICAFMSHCCQFEHYTFSILKCGKTSCEICRPVRLPPDVFKTLRHIPLPVPGEDGHYISFSDAMKISTTGEHRPSIKKPVSKRKTLPFYASVQHVTNAQILVQCDICKMWRLIFSKKKLSSEMRKMLQQLLSNYSYSCGSKLQDLDLPDCFKDVEVRDHSCHSPVERLYYSAKYEPICVYCSKDQPWTVDIHYPQCEQCSSFPPIKK